MPQFSHLHVHTEYSLLDGMASAEKLFEKAKKDNMPALAITDHGNMFGVMDFLAEGWKKNNVKIVGKDDHGNDIIQPIVKPIIGCEFYMVEDRFIKSFTKEKKDKRYHQLLLAKNKIGYQNLSKLSSLGYIEGFYSKYPRIDKKLIEQYHEGLIATTCCIGAIIPQYILHESEEKVEQELQWWLHIFGKDFFIELQNHGIEEQKKINDVLIKLSKKYQIPAIATNDSHYVDKEDATVHDILLCMQTGAMVKDPGMDDFTDGEETKKGRFKFPSNNFYLKTTQEMSILFKEIPEALDNTNIIVDRVELYDIKQDLIFPDFPLPKEFQLHAEEKLNQWAYLQYLTQEGARKRYGEITAVIQNRLDFELSTIKKMGFSGYFLIVWDFIRYARDNNIRVGPGRGSVAGSVVSYCLEITNVDPFKYGLLFERFLNPDRKSMPDIDTDFDVVGRIKVMEYVAQKYGRDQVGQIITISKMAAKSSIKDAARVLDFPLALSARLNSLIPATQKEILLSDLLNPSVKNEFSTDPRYQQNIETLRSLYANSNSDESKILKIAEQLDGIVRGTGVHAAGVIIAPKDLKEILPVAISKESPYLLTQYHKDIIESVGVIKMDFLGLRNLNIIYDTLALIKKNHGVDIDIDSISLDDKKTFALFQRADTFALFQFESSGMREWLKKLKPDRFSDLIALNALFRPGPMKYIDTYIARKFGKEKIEYDLPEMEEILSETYGITVYQEQVMLLSRKLSEFTEGDADLLRKAMGKKDIKTMHKIKEKFMNQAGKRFPLEKLEKIWKDWESFAEYAFNKSHSTCYAFVAFQTGYLKANYPQEYMSQVLNWADTADRKEQCLEDCYKMNLIIARPDINISAWDYLAEKEGNIRMGLKSVKGLSESFATSVMHEREINGPFTNFYDFVERMKKANGKGLTKTCIEVLAYSGSLDCFSEYHRAQYFFTPPGERLSALEKILQSMDSIEKKSKNKYAGPSLFGEPTKEEKSKNFSLPPCPEMEKAEKLKHEKNIVGMFISGHPLDIFNFELGGIVSRYKIFPLKDFAIYKERLLNEMTLNSTGRDKTNLTTLKIAGMITAAQHRKTKTGREYGSFVLEDKTGSQSFNIWAENYLKYKHFLQVDQAVYIKGSFVKSYNQSDIEFQVGSIYSLYDLKKQETRSITLTMEDPNVLTKDFIKNLQQLIKTKRGNTVLKIVLKDRESDTELSLVNKDIPFEMSDEIVDFLQNTLTIQFSIDTLQ
ncbi:MAG: DNA polymerase III subunit alpha [Phycisphaerales bacterium]|nr:DNA polymerase III subunit alpha [Phycisphaerales bacterium]